MTLPAQYTIIINIYYDTLFIIASDRNSSSGIQTTALKPEGSVPKNFVDQIRLRTASMSSSLTGSFKSKRDSQNIEASNLISEPEVDVDHNGQ